jgi:hypothetical protein
MFGFGGLLSNGSASEATVVVSCATAVLLKLPPPPQAAGKEAASELWELAATLAQQEADDVSEFWARERARPAAASSGRMHFKVSSLSGHVVCSLFGTSVCLYARGAVQSLRRRAACDAAEPEPECDVCVRAPRLHTERRSSPP